MKQRTVIVLSLVGGVFGFWLAGMIQLGLWVASSLAFDRALLGADPTLAVETQLRLMPARPIEPELGVSADETQAAPHPNVVSLEPVLITGAMRPRAVPPLRVIAPSPAAASKPAANSVAPAPLPLRLPLPLPLPLPIDPIEPEPESGPQLRPSLESPGQTAPVTSHGSPGQVLEPRS